MAPVIRWMLYDATTGGVLFIAESHPTVFDPTMSAWPPGQRVRVLRGDDDWARGRWYRVNLDDIDGPLLRDEEKIATREAMLPGSTRMRD